MRNMSFSLTTPQMKAGTKTVTRRLGWSFLKEGDLVMAVEKCQGLKKGEKVKKIGIIEILRIRCETLDDITHGDVVLEGFPEMTTEEFISMFCKANKCDRSTLVNRIEFRHYAYSGRAYHDNDHAIRGSMTNEMIVDA